MSPRRATRARRIAHEVLRVRRRGTFTGSTLPNRYVLDQGWRNRHVYQPVARRSQRETAALVRHHGQARKADAA